MTFTRICVVCVGLVVALGAGAVRAAAPPETNSPAPPQTETARAAQSLFSLAWLLDRPVAREELMKLPQWERTPLRLDDLLEAATQLKLPLRRQEISSVELQVFGGPALLELRNPTEFVALAAIGEDNVLFYDAGRMDLRPREEVEQRFAGMALLFDGEPARASFSVTNPLRTARLASDEETHLENVVVTNRGEKPLQVQVESVSCGCTVADHAPQTIAPGQSVTLVFTMNTQKVVKKTVYATLKTNDAAWPKVLLSFTVEREKPESKP